MYWGLKWTFSSFCFRVCLTCLATRHLQHRYLYAWQLIVLEKALIYSAWTLNGTCCWRQAKISFAQTSKDDSWLYVRTVKDWNGKEKDEMTIIVKKRTMCQLIWFVLLIAVKLEFLEHLLIDMIWSGRALGFWKWCSRIFF